MAKQCLAERGIVGDAAFHGVGLLRADDGVEFLVARFHVLDLDGAAEADLALGVLCLVNNDGVGENIFNLGDAAIKLGLLVLGFVVFGELPDGLSLIGYIIICGISLLMYMYNMGYLKIRKDATHHEQD